MFSQRSEIISLISTSCVIYMVARILRSFKEGILFLGRHVSSRKWAPYSPHLYNYDDCTGDCTWAGMTLKQRETAMFWNSFFIYFFYKNVHFVAPNTCIIPLKTFSNFFLIHLTMKTWQKSFFWCCSDIFVLDKLSFYPLKCTLLLFQVRIKLCENYWTIHLLQKNLRKQKKKFILDVFHFATF